MDPQEHRDGGMSDEDPTQWYRGLSIRSRLLVAALHFGLLFVVLLAVYFTLDYFLWGDQRGDVVGSLAGAAERSALFSACYVVLLPFQWRLQRWIHGNDQQRR